MTATIVKALVKISDPRNPEFEFTGERDNWGTKIKKKVVKYIDALTMFDIAIFPADEQKWLWDQGAICEVSDQELAVWEQLSASERSSRTFHNGPISTFVESEQGRIGDRDANPIIGKGFLNGVS